MVDLDEMRRFGGLFDRFASEIFVTAFIAGSDQYSPGYVHQGNAKYMDRAAFVLACCELRDELRAATGTGGSRNV